MQVLSGSSTLSTTRALPISESYFIQPGGIGMHGKISIHLEGHIHLVDAGSAGGVTAVHVMGHAVIGEADEDHIRRRPLKFPCQMVPDKGGRGRTGDSGGNPVASRVPPHVPVAALDVALRAVDELVDAIG